MTEHDPRSTPRPVELELELRPPTVAVAGFPCLLVLVLRNPASAPIRVGLPALADLACPTQLSAIWRDDSRVLAQAWASPRGVAEFIEPCFGLGPGEARRMLVDLEELFSGLPPGQGVLEVDYQGTGAVGRCPLAVAEASAAEQRFAARRPAGRSWQAWLLTDDAVADLLRATLPTHAWPTLALGLACASVVRAPALAELPAAAFDALAQIFDAEAACFAYEVAVAGGLPEAARARAAALARWPEISWRLDDVDRGRGALKLLRECS